MSAKLTKQTHQILIWTDDLPLDTKKSALPDFRSGNERSLKPVNVDADKLTGSLQNLLKALDPFLSTPAKDSGLSLDELELNLKVSATGEVGFIASVSAAAEASITLRLKRR